MLAVVSVGDMAAQPTKQTVPSPAAAKVANCIGFIILGGYF
jgi:hypothetical protein